MSCDRCLAESLVYYHKPFKNQSIIQQLSSMKYLPIEKNMCSRKAASVGLSAAVIDILPGPIMLPCSV